MTRALWYKHRRSLRTRFWLGGVGGTYLLVVVVALSLKVWGSNLSLPVPGEVDLAEISAVRFKRNSERTEIEEDDEKENCTPRAVNNFPGNFMSLKDTQDGGVFVHILIALYLFAALAIVCDDYFVPSLERICEDMGLQEDVAGATFMAAGSSAPELCTSIVGVFIAKSDVGVGTIVGSAVFNILFIIGVCGLFAGMVVELTWYPLVRDTLFYLISVLALVIIIQDSKVHWYEALVMLLLYFIYILIMYYNRRLEKASKDAVARLRARFRRGDETRQPLLGDLRTDESAVREVGTDGESLPPVTEADTGFNDTVSKEYPVMKTEDADIDSPWDIPENFFARVLWVAMVPIKIICHFTIPDCRRSGLWRRLYPVTFINSVAWIAIFTYVLVWMITIAGDALDVPDTVMGLTLLAAGTSLPDCMASILVARAGLGDMAVSNSIGSNVFDILICLSIPWLIDTAAVHSGESLEINSSGLLYSSITLLATVAFLLVSIALNRWRLNKPYGLACLLAYVIVITLSSLYELNVFADLNPPACPR